MIAECYRNNKIGLLGIFFVGAISVFVASCLSDSDKCGDMILVSGESMNMSDLCMPKTLDTSTATQPSESILDGGDTGDAAVEDVCDCKDGEYCDRALMPPICKPPATGQGEPCSAPEDCANFEADYCESFVSQTCLVQNCSPELNNCSDGYLCCDFTWMGLPTLCVNSELSGGECVEAP